MYKVHDLFGMSIDYWLQNYTLKFIRMPHVIQLAIVIYPHCVSIVASQQTKLWNESTTAMVMWSLPPGEVGGAKSASLRQFCQTARFHAKDHKLPQLSTTLGIKRMQACLWDMLIIYAVRIVIYPHCLSIVASRQTKLWNESAPDPRQLLCYASSTRNCDWTTQPENATQQLRMPNYYIPQSLILKPQNLVTREPP